jgi:hypothetical protein
MTEAVLVRYPDPYQPSTIAGINYHGLTWQKCPQENGVFFWSMVCWNMAAQAASTTTSYSEPVVDGLFTMEGNIKRSPT